MFTFDPGLTIWTLLTFAGLCVLLAKFAYKPLRKALDEREQTIRDSLDKSREARDQAVALLDQNRAQLNTARDEARRIIDEGQRVVEDMKREAADRAALESRAIVDQARGEIDREVNRSLDELKSTVSNLSVRIARQVIKGELNETRHDELADDFIERLKKTHAKRSS